MAKTFNFDATLQHVATKETVTLQGEIEMGDDHDSADAARGVRLGVERHYGSQGWIATKTHVAES